MNATPQKMSDAAGEVERFIGNIAANRKERKPIRPTIVEVRSHLFRRHKFSHFIKLINIPVAQMVEPLAMVMGSNPRECMN